MMKVRIRLSPPASRRPPPSSPPKEQASPAAAAATSTPEEEDEKRTSSSPLFKSLRTPSLSPRSRSSLSRSPSSSPSRRRRRRPTEIGDVAFFLDFVTKFRIVPFHVTDILAYSDTLGNGQKTVTVTRWFHTVSLYPDMF